MTMISGTEDGVLSLPNKLGFRRRPLLTPDPFGVFSEAFARYMGTPAFIGWMSVSARLEHLGSPRVEQCHRGRSNSVGMGWKVCCVVC